MMDTLDWLLNALFWALLVLPGWLMILSPVFLLLLFLFLGIRAIVRATRKKRVDEE